MKKLFRIGLALLCCVGLVAITNNKQQKVEAARAPVGGSNELSTSKTAEETGTKGEYDVTFTFPATEQGEKFTDADVVIVMDKSTLADLPGLKEATSSFVDAMLAKEADGVNFKVGVVWFNFDAHDGTTGLIDLDATSSTTIKNAIQDGGGAGSNVEGGLIRADQWLSADTNVSNKCKFVILASDLSGYAIDNGTGQGLVRYANGQGYVGNAGLQLKYGYGSELGGITSTDIDSLIKNKTLLNGVAADSNAFDKTNENGWLQYTGGPIGTSPLLSSDWNKPGFATAYEQSIYYCGNQLLAMNQKGYNIVAVTQPYSRGVNFLTVNTAFQNWFEENIGLRYDSTAVTPENAFKDISSQVFDLLGKGEVIDSISDNFDIVMKDGKLDDTFRVLVDDTALNSTKIDDTHYAFGDKLASGKYPFIASYDAATKTVKWEINTTVSRYKKVQAAARVKYNKEIGENDITTTTNDSAVINYMSSLDADNGVTQYNKSYSYDNPIVVIKGNGSTPQIESHKLTVNYVYADGSEASKTISQTVEKDKAYSITSPTIKGYTPDKAVIEGKMGSEDLEFTVVYKKIAANDKTSNNDTNSGVVNTNDASNMALMLGLLLASAMLIVLNKKVTNRK